MYILFPPSYEKMEIFEHPVQTRLFNIYIFFFIFFLPSHSPCTDLYIYVLSDANSRPNLNKHATPRARNDRSGRNFYNTTMGARVVYIRVHGFILLLLRYVRLSSRHKKKKNSNPKRRRRQSSSCACVYIYIYVCMYRRDKFDSTRRRAINRI